MKKPSIRSLATAALGASLIFAATTGPAHASKSYGSCAELQAKYPNGVAKNKAAAQRAVTDGMNTPVINAALYKKHFKSLDRDRDGVMCEVMAALGLGGGGGVGDPEGAYQP